MITVITINIGTPYLLTICVLNFEIVRYTTSYESKILLYVWQTV